MGPKILQLEISLWPTTLDIFQMGAKINLQQADGWAKHGKVLHWSRGFEVIVAYINLFQVSSQALSQITRKYTELTVSHVTEQGKIT